jgi:hypothetical protein
LLSKGIAASQKIFVSIDWGASPHHAYAAWHMVFRMELEEQPFVLPELDQSRAGRQAVIQAKYQRAQGHGDHSEGPQTAEMIVTFREKAFQGLGDEALAAEAYGANRSGRSR